MDPVKVGLVETKQAIDFAIALGKAVENSQEDGVWNLMDIPNFIPAIVKLLPAVQGGDQIPIEFVQLTPEQLDELKTYVTAELDLNDEEVEAFIEDAFKVMLDIFMLVKLYFTPSEDVTADQVPE
jgi:hypothetical protein